MTGESVPSMEAADERLPAAVENLLKGLEGTLSDDEFDRRLHNFNKENELQLGKLLRRKYMELPNGREVTIALYEKGVEIVGGKMSEENWELA